MVCPDSTLAPGASTTCTATYTVTQADVDHGQVDDSAIASGAPPQGLPIDSGPSSFSIPVGQAPAISVAKSATPGRVTAAGQVVSYSFLVTNTGILTLSDVSVTDIQVAPASQANLSAITCPTATLAPGAAMTCTATYTVTQADLDNGSITDSATTSGTPPTGPPVTSPPSTATVSADQTAALQIVKSASVSGATHDGVATLGAHITWTFVVTNTGTVTIKNIQVADPIAGAVRCPQSSLAPGDQMTCVAQKQHVVSATDVAAGRVVNVATAGGDAPCVTPGPTGPVTGQDATTVADLSTCQNPVRSDPSRKVVPVSPPVVISRPSPPLAFTGARGLPILVFGALLALLAGAVLTIVGRKRGSAS